MARSGLRTRLVGQAILLLALGTLGPPAVTAQPFITEFRVPTIPSSSGEGPTRITTGPDGNLWFTELGGNKIGRITLAGVITEFPLPPALSRPVGIATGPDGNLWFTAGNQIGRITPAGVISGFPLPTASSGPAEITAGPDGNLWFTEFINNKIGRITPAGVVTEFPILIADAHASGITTGPDGNLWFIEEGPSNIGRITPDGVITEFPVPTPFGGGPRGITAGPDGNLWFAGGLRIGRITPDGVITEFPLVTAFSSSSQITAGPDGNLWVTEAGLGSSQIGRITPAGVLTDFFLAFSSIPAGITAGPDRNLWFTEPGANRIGRLRPPPVVTISPASGGYATTQSFALVVTVVTGGPQIAGGQLLFDDTDVTLDFFGCAIFGTLAAGGQTARCPGLSGGSFAPGGHTLKITINLTDGSVAKDTVNWQIEPNQEP